jgi:hypothetical protein
MISVVEVDINKQSCGDKVAPRSYCSPEDYEAIDVTVGCYVRCASAVEDTPRGTILIMGRSCADSDTWVNPGSSLGCRWRVRGLNRSRSAQGRWQGSGSLLRRVIRSLSTASTSVDIISNGHEDNIIDEYEPGVLRILTVSPATLLQST